MATMLMLIIASAVQWGRNGPGLLVDNWHAGTVSSVSSGARQIFDGFCIGILGLTGFEGTLPLSLDRVI